MFFLSGIFGAILLAVFVFIGTGIFVLIGDSLSKAILKSVVLFSVLIGVFIAIALVRSYFTNPMTVDKADVYGTYVIDRTMYPGKNADWQYDHYRFEITESDSIKFYVTNRKYVVRKYEGKVEIKDNGVIVPKIAWPDSVKYHVLAENPTLYRKPFSFYYVFHSPLYGNMFFTKGKYKMIEED